MYINTTIFWQIFQDLQFVNISSPTQPENPGFNPEQEHVTNNNPGQETAW